MTIPTIAALPTAPARTDAPATFVTRADAFVAALPTLRTEINATTTAIDAVASTVDDDKVLAAASQVAAASSETNAAASASAADATANAVLWVSAGSYTAGQNRYSPINYLTYRAITTHSGETTDPSADTTNWVGVAPGSAIVRVARTSNTIIGVANLSNLIDITSGTFTQTFTAAATLGDGWFCYIRNAGTGDITLDPSGAETIDGLANFIMYPGEVRLIQCDGTALRSVVLTAFSRTFTASGTFTKPPGYSYFGGLIWSAGASGGKNASGNNVNGGGGGGCFDFVFPSSTLSATETMTIGAGGAAISGSANFGNDGGNTSLGSLITVFGADASSGIGGSILGAATGPASSDTMYAATAPGTTGTNLHSAYSGGTPAAQGNQPTQAQLYGAAAGGSIGNASILRTAGTSIFGGDGGAAVLASNGTSGVAPGGGGGATETGGQSGAGARGEIRIWGLV